jgi:hypothetical protein
MAIWGAKSILLSYIFVANQKCYEKDSISSFIDVHLGMGIFAGVLSQQFSY